MDFDRCDPDDDDVTIVGDHELVVELRRIADAPRVLVPGAPLPPPPPAPVVAPALPPSRGPEPGTAAPVARRPAERPARSRRVARASSTAGTTRRPAPRRPVPAAPANRSPAAAFGAPQPGPAAMPAPRAFEAWYDEDDEPGRSGLVWVALAGMVAVAVVVALLVLG